MVTMADWTDERVETLKRFCGQGLAFSAIAERMGMTRSAVLGKAFRMKLRKTPAAPPRTRKRHSVTDNGKRILIPPHVADMQKAEAAMKAVAPKQEPKKQPPDGAPAPLNVELLDLTDQNCRWPVNDGGPFLFCGHDRAHGSSYCEFHDDVSRHGYPKQKLAEAA